MRTTGVGRARTRARLPAEAGALLIITLAASRAHAGAEDGRDRDRPQRHLPCHVPPSAHCFAATSPAAPNFGAVQLPHTQGYVQSATFLALSGMNGLQACARTGPSVFHTTWN